MEKQSTYKLIVPEKVEAKIRHLISRYPHTEWSGVLFYSHTGSFEDNSLQLTCEDFILMDIGTSGWTQFRMNEDVAAYMADNMELFDCELGILHSHHTLGAFFSGQDKRRLQEDGNDTNCFLSLVVDTPGNYVAALTRKVTTKKSVTVSPISTSYEFFGEGNKQVASPASEPETTIVESSIIECYNLIVEREAFFSPFMNLDARITEVENKKQSTLPPSQGFTPSQNNFQTTKDWLDTTYNHPVEDKRQLTLFDDAEFSVYPSPSKEDIDLAVSRMLLCNPLLTKPYEKLDEWVDKMDTYYDKAFLNNDFDAWADFMVDFCLEGFLPEHFDAEFDVDQFNCEVAQALSEELSKYADASIYISTYTEKLEKYILL